MLAKRPDFAIGDSFVMYDSTGVCTKTSARYDSAGVCPKAAAVQADAKAVNNSPKVRMDKGMKRNCLGHV